jgi:glycosyltransferase involved in cell wall biosynthesis
MLDIQIIVVAFNRPEHLRRVINALRINKILNFSVFIDNARNEADMLQQRKIAEIIANVDWASVNVVYRSINLGLARSISFAISETLRAHDAVIVLEDDCVPEPGFFDYMRAMLDAYQYNFKIRSICGFLYPGCPVDPGISAFLSKRFCPWGWATWKNRWADFYLDLPIMVERLKSAGVSFGSLGNDIVRYCADEHFLHSQADIWSLSWILCHALDESLCVYPTSSLIRNIGFDNSGVHSIETSVFEHTTELKYPFRRQNIKDSIGQVVYDQTASRYIISFLEQFSKMTMYLEK